MRWEKNYGTFLRIIVWVIYVYFICELKPHIFMKYIYKISEFFFSSTEFDQQLLIRRCMINSSLQPYRLWNCTIRPDKHGRVVLVPSKSVASVRYCTEHWTSHILQGTRSIHVQLVALYVKNLIQMDGTKYVWQKDIFVFLNLFELKLKHLHATSEP